jgi:hypothetical protein
MTPHMYYILEIQLLVWSVQTQALRFQYMAFSLAKLGIIWHHDGLQLSTQHLQLLYLEAFCTLPKNLKEVLLEY